MISNKKKLVWILTYDLKINQTYVFRYASFIKKLNTKNIETLGIGLRFPFKPHPLNNLSLREKTDVQFETKNIEQLNLVQRLLFYIDKNNYPFSVKKLFLALHIMIYKVDQWFVKLSNFKALHQSDKPSIIISGGSGGVIKTSYLLSKKYNSKLILDYRDPWNFGYHLLETNKLIYLFKKKFTLKTEKKILDYAHHITTVSESLKNFF